jgi:hypothetical protein
MSKYPNRESSLVVTTNSYFQYYEQKAVFWKLDLLPASRGKVGITYPSTLIEMNSSKDPTEQAYLTFSCEDGNKSSSGTVSYPHNTRRWKKSTNSVKLYVAYNRLVYVMKDTDLQTWRRTKVCSRHPTVLNLHPSCNARMSTRCQFSDSERTDLLVTNGEKQVRVPRSFERTITYTADILFLLVLFYDRTCDQTHKVS